MRHMLHLLYCCAFLVMEDHRRHIQQHGAYVSSSDDDVGGDDRGECIFFY